MFSLFKYMLVKHKLRLHAVNIDVKSFITYNLELNLLTESSSVLGRGGLQCN